MRSDVEDFELARPGSLDEALRAMDAEPGAWRPLAGGTDVMVLLSAGKLLHRRFLDLWGIDELRGIDVAPDAITFGALTTYTEIARHPVVTRELPMMTQAARETGGVAIQNRGTIGGNVANASPAADTPPALLAYGASIELASAGGRRWVDYASFHLGYKETAMSEREIITRVRVPRAPDRMGFYRKVGPRRAQAISKVCFAGCARMDGERALEMRIALGGVAPVVVRATGAERTLVEHGLGPSVVARAREALASSIAPIDDVRSTARYRLRVAENLLAAFVAELRTHVGLAP
jgi:CO/xanthine dehydrogenase FAD-binding subunit